MKRLAIISTHPIQYNAPFFALLARHSDVELKVFYTYSQGFEAIPDSEFGKTIRWDIPLLEGYQYEVVPNEAPSPALTFGGVKNSQLLVRLTAWKPDTILVFGWSLSSHLSVMRHFKGRVRVLFRGDSTLLNEHPGWKTVLRRIFLTWVYRHVDGAFFVGENNRRYFKAHGLRDQQLFFAGHAVDNARFAATAAQPYEEQARQWRRKLGFADSDLVMVYAGKLIECKNLSLLVELFREQDFAPGWKLLLIGNGAKEETLKHQAGESSRIRFLPFQNQSKMPLIYRLGNLTVLPSLQETWGLAVNEAMACGRPVLVSDRVGCAADLVRQGENGWTFPVSKAKKAIPALLLGVDHTRLWQMGQNATRVIADWSFDALAESIARNS